MVRVVPDQTLSSNFPESEIPLRSALAAAVAVNTHDPRTELPFLEQGINLQQEPATPLSAFIQ